MSDRNCNNESNVINTKLEKVQGKLTGLDATSKCSKFNGFPSLCKTHSIAKKDKLSLQTFNCFNATG